MFIKAGLFSAPLSFLKDSKKEKERNRGSKNRGIYLIVK